MVIFIDVFIIDIVYYNMVIWYLRWYHHPLYIILYYINKTEPLLAPKPPPNYHLDIQYTIYRIPNTILQYTIYHIIIYRLTAVVVVLVPVVISTGCLLNLNLYFNLNLNQNHHQNKDWSLKLNHLWYTVLLLDESNDFLW